MTCLILTSCCFDSAPQYTEKTDFVIAKDVNTKRRDGDVYRIAFASGYDTQVSYGDYSRLKIGDTVTIRFYASGWHDIIK